MCPLLHRSRAKNKMLYGYLGGKEFLTNSQRYLERRIKLECDGEVVDLPQRLQGLVFLNIPSYMAGTNFWGTEREKDVSHTPKFPKPFAFDDPLPNTLLRPFISLMILYQPNYD